VIDYAVCLNGTVYDSIIVPTDGSEAAEEAADHGVAQAAAHDAHLVFLAVVEMSGTGTPDGRDDQAFEEQRAARRDEVEALVAVAESAGVDAEGVVEMGVPSRVILEQAAARAADLLVMATRARSGVGRFLYGSVTEQVIRDGDTPVLAVQR
jgi:nucleotide-binding universal stress UspA family protein